LISITAICLTVAVFFSAVPVVYGADLLELYDEAVSRDPAFSIVGSTLNMTRSRLEQSESMLKPQINLIAKPQIIRGTESYINSSLNVTLSQTVLNYDRWNAIDEVSADVEHDEAELEEARQDLMMRVVTAYFDLLDASKGVELAEAEKASIGLQLKELQQKFDAGYATNTDLYEVKADYDLALSESIDAQLNLDNAREVVAEIVGDRPGEVDPLEDDIPLIRPEPLDMNSWVDRALKQNLDVVAQQATVKSLNEALSRAKGGHMPSLDLIAGYTFSDTTGARFGKRISNKSVGIELNVPVYSGGLISAKVREATEKYFQAKTILEQIRRETTRKCRSAYLAVNAGIAQVQARRKYLVSSKAMLEATREELKAGNKIEGDLVDAQRDVYRAEKDLGRARYDYLLSVLSLKQVVGGLRYLDIVSIDRFLE